MKCHLMSLGLKVWEATEKEYKIYDQAPTDSVKLSQYEGNPIDLNEILSGLTKFVFTKVLRCKTAKQAQHNLKIIHEGESKVKESKLQKCKGKFEILKMKEEENMGKYLIRVDEFVNANRGLEGKLK